jgi:hypothetical protein
VTAARLAAGWCVLFAVPHVYWALGGHRGLASSAGVELATTRPLWFVLLGLWGVALVLLLGAGYCFGLERWRLRGLPRRAVVVLGVLGGALLLIRGVLLEVVLGTGAGGVAAAVGPVQAHWSLVLWNPWFALGGVLVLLAVRRFATGAAR